MPLGIILPELGLYRNDMLMQIIWNYQDKYNNWNIMYPNPVIMIHCSSNIKWVKLNNETISAWLNIHAKDRDVEEVWGISIHQLYQEKTIAAKTTSTVTEYMRRLCIFSLT